MMETIEERDARAELHDRARHWFPRLPDDLLDQIVAAAWLEAIDGARQNGRPLPTRAADGVRRYGIRALDDDGLELPADAEARIAALELDSWSLEHVPEAEDIATAPKHDVPRQLPHWPARLAGVGALLAVAILLVAILAGGGSSEPQTPARHATRTTPPPRATVDPRADQALRRAMGASIAELARQRAEQTRGAERARAKRARAARRRAARERAKHRRARRPTKHPTPPPSTTPPATPPPTPPPPPSDEFGFED